MRVLHVSAGGKGERIADYIASSPSPGLPKHLLPLPISRGSILGEIVGSAEAEFDKVCLWASEENRSHFLAGIGEGERIEILVDRDMTGPLGPVARHLLGRHERTYGCAGDFYCEFSWREFERFHEGHGFPVSILVAKSLPVPKGARFLLEGTRVTGWERVEMTAAEDLINIGAYILDPAPEVLRIVGGLPRHKEDPFFDALVAEGLVAGYDPGVTGYNVNVPEVYVALCDALR